MKSINLILLFLLFNIITFGQKSKSSTKIPNIMESNKNDLFESLQGEHQLRDDAGWITFENYSFKASVKWTRKDKMLGLGSGNSGQSRYTTSANIKGQYSIEEIKLNRNLDYKEKDKYGDVVGTISRGFLIGYKIYFSGKDQNGDNYNFCRIVYQPYNNGYIESWFVGDYFVNSNSRYECENTTKEIDFAFELNKNNTNRSFEPCADESNLSGLRYSSGLLNNINVLQQNKNEMRLRENRKALYLKLVDIKLITRTYYPNYIDNNFDSEEHILRLYSFYKKHSLYTKPITNFYKQFACDIYPESKFCR
jgi:hypothetical protein